MDQTNHIHIGKPIIDAVDLTTHQEWMGGAIHYSVPVDLLVNLNGFDKYVVQHHIPIEKGYKDRYTNEKSINYALNWVFQHCTTQEETIRDREQRGLRPKRPFLKDIGKHFDKYDWLEFASKEAEIQKLSKFKDNTMDFMKYICECFDNEDKNSVDN